MVVHFHFLLVVKKGVGMNIKIVLFKAPRTFNFKQALSNYQNGNLMGPICSLSLRFKKNLGELTKIGCLYVHGQVCSIRSSFQSRYKCSINHSTWNKRRTWLEKPYGSTRRASLGKLEQNYSILFFYCENFIQFFRCFQNEITRISHFI